MRDNGSGTSPVDFLAHLHPNRPIALTSILDGAIDTWNDWSGIEDWIAKANGHRNLYFNPNVVRQGLKSRAKKKDIIAAQVVHVDIDVRKGQNIASEQRRLLGMISAFPVAPSVIIFSGGGYNLLWLLREPWLLDGDAAIERVEAVNRKFERWFGSEDNCSDVSRILRLPGTMNVLNEVKRANGRVPARSEVVKEDWGLRYGLEELEEVVALPELAKWWLGPLLITGARPEKEYPSRSEAVWAAVCELVRSGGSDELISWIILNENLAISAHVREQGNPPRYAARQISDARKVVVVGQEFVMGEVVWKELKPREDYRLGDFQAYMPRISFIYMPNGDFWSSEGVNGVVSGIGLFDLDGKAIGDGGKPVVLPATEWLKRYRPVAQATWVPGEGPIVEGRLMVEGGWIEQSKVRVFNQYRPPDVRLGESGKAGPWVKLVWDLYPDIAELLIQCFAKRRQRPQDMINFFVLLIGQQGIGKDTILEPVRRAVGEWNCKTISPSNLTDSFAPWKKSVILNINEAHDDEGGGGGFGTINRRQVYESLKELSTAPPNTLYVNEKHRAQYYIAKALFPIVTSNYPLSAIYLPKDDRRALVGNSDRVKGWKDAEWFVEFYRWLEVGGGYGHVAAYLQELDISGVNFRREPIRTDAWRVIVNASLSVAAGELGDVLDMMGWPDVVTVDLVRRVYGIFGNMDTMESDLNGLFTSTAKAKQLNYRFADNGYVTVGNRDRSDGLWMIDGKRKSVFAKQELNPATAQRKARALAAMGREEAVG
jgi:hypothetical protein